MLTDAENFALLRQDIPNADDLALARAHAPRICFDALEPFTPSVVGYTVFRQEAASPSFPRHIRLQNGAVVCIEYAIWWDWDIQHLYELEHAWVYLDAAGALVDAEASWHGGMHPMRDESGAIPTEDGRLKLHSEPGKHAFAPSPAWLLQRQPITDVSCTTRSGVGGVWVTPLFDGVIHDRNPLNNQLVHSYLLRQAFTPTYDFSKRFALETATFVPWDSLNAWVPGRVSWWLAHLDATIPPQERRVLRIAHRGASAHAQENSAESFRLAAEMGADMVEVDVRVTADDVPVIAHDETLDRVYGVPGVIAQLTLAQLQALAPVLTLEALLEQCRALGLGIYLDIKALTPTSAQEMFRLVDAFHMTKAVIFSSFRVDTVAEIKRHRPDVNTSILFGSTHVDAVALGKAVQADYVHPCWELVSDDPSELLTPAWMAAVRENGFGVVTWHEERPQVIAALKRLGVNGICSDEPALLRDT